MTDRDTVAEQRETWDAVSPGWLHWLSTFERGGLPITARLLDLGRVRAGQALLDVGTGAGEPAISAARLVGPGGRVVGVDVSEAMINAARRRAAGLPNVAFLHRAVEELDFRPESFQVVLSRWCLMFLTDLSATLRTLYRLLTPGGVLAAAVWGPPAVTPIVGLPFQVLSTQLQLSPVPAGQPGAYGLSDPRICRARLRDAGFVDVVVAEEIAPFWLESSADYVRFALDILPPSVSEVLADWCTAEERARIRDALVRAAAEHATADGRILLPSTVLCLRAVKPPRRP